MSGLLRALGPADLAQSHELGVLAFGGDRAAPPPTSPRPGRHSVGVLDGDRLLAKASVVSYEQWWGGRRVPMGGVAGVAVHPEARGRGLARRLLTALLAQMAEAGQGISVLFPTAVGIYRPHGWEGVGGLAQTRLATRDLLDGGNPGPVRVRTAGPDDLPAVQRVWDAFAAAGNGQLSRSGPAYPRGAHQVLESDVVALAVDGGQVLGYAAYDRGHGYGAEAALTVREFVAHTPQAHAALLRSLGSWDSVAGTVLWPGDTRELALHLHRAVPPPHRVQPWMLRVVDAPTAVAARGWPEGVHVDNAFVLLDPDVPAHARAWRCTLAGGRGTLQPVPATSDLPRLHVRGLALLWSGAAGTAAVRRAGLLDGALPGIDAACAGAAPALLDYF